MSASTTSPATIGDAELIAAVRGGDLDAYGQLFERHVEAARRLARQLVSAGDVEDLVSEAFMKVLRVLQRGGGPDVAFRAYLLTAVRSLRVDRLRAGARLHTTDDLDPFDPGVPFRDTAVEGFENAAAARAFASLPERWQLVLWHTEVEGSRPADIAPILGMTPNSVSALAYRAREGLRQAFLNEHGGDLEGDECRWTHDHLGAYVRKGASRRDAQRVEQHLGECRSCAAIYLELTEVNSNLGAVLAPLVLGGLAAAYVAQTGAGGVGLLGGISALAGRVRDAVAANAAASSVAGVVATVTIVGGAMTIGSSGPDGPTALADAPAAATTSDTASAPSGRAAREGAGGTAVRRGNAIEVALPGRTDDLPATGDPTPTDGTAAPTDDPGQDLTQDPTLDPGQDPTQAPTQNPTGSPTATPSQDPTEDPTRDPTPTAQPTPTSQPTPSPTRNPSPTRSPSPTREPSPTYSPTSSPTPTATPTSTPTQEPPVRADVSVSARVSGRGPTFVVTVSVAGLPADASAVLSVSGEVPEIGSRDPRCSNDGRAVTCKLAAGGAGAPVDLDVTAPHGGVVTVSAATDLDDPDLGNNRVNAVLP